MRRLGYLPLLLFLVLLVLLPLVFGQLFTTALIKLRLEPFTAILLITGIILGGGINIPLKRIARNETLVEDPLAILARISHEDLYCNRRYAATTSLTAGGLAAQSVNILFQVCLLPSRLLAPVSRATRRFRHELS
jgi:hypothetical protein